MVNINIEIPEELHKKLKLESILDDVTLKELIIKVLVKNSKGNKKVQKLMKRK